MWEQTLSGLIKALRASKDDEARVIKQALEEIKREVASSDVDLKAGAVLKLCYLEMLGYGNLSQEGFRVVECMADPKLHIKQIGYLAAAQTFGPKTEVSMLITNLVKKDLASPSPASLPLLASSSTTPAPPVLSLTLGSLPHLLTEENAPDLMPDLVAMLNHSRPAIRKRAVLVMHSLAKRDVTASRNRQVQGEHWDGVASGGPAQLRIDRNNVWVERMRERLRDDDQGVVGAVVNVVCELAMRDPVPWLEVAPELYGLLTAGNNNWMLIKIVKLFAVLTPIEPRLVKKLLPPITNLIATTSAMSLLYECIHTCIVGGMLTHTGSDSLAATCVSKLSAFLEDADQNLRYIALVALGKLLPIHPHLVSHHRETILASVDDPDETIRLRALDLVQGMVDRSNLEDVVSQLIGHLEPSRPSQSASSAMRALQDAINGEASAVLTSAAYRQHLVSIILKMCSKDIYANITDFEWYIDLLVRLAYTALSLPTAAATDAAQQSSIGAKLAEDLTDVCARVKAIRPYAASKMLRLLTDETFIAHCAEGRSKEGLAAGVEVGRVLAAGAWIVGEYNTTLPDARPAISALFSSSLNLVDPKIQAHCLHNGAKVFAKWALDVRDAWDEDGAEEDLEQLKRVINAVLERVEQFTGSEDVELQERAAELSGLMAYLKQGVERFQVVAKPTQPPAVTPSNTFRYGDGSGFHEDNPFASSSITANDPTMSNGATGREEPEDRLGPPCLAVLRDMFFSHELNPVAAKAQSLVAPPEGLDLDSWIVGYAAGSDFPDPEDSEGDAGPVDEYGRSLAPQVEARQIEGADTRKKKGKDRDGKKKSRKGKEREEDSEAIAKVRAERLEQRKNDPYYIPTKPKSSKRSSQTHTPNTEDDDVNAIPIVKLDLTGLDSAPSRGSQGPRRPVAPPPIIDVEGEMPEAVLLRPSPAATPAVGTPLEPGTPQEGGAIGTLVEAERAIGAGVVKKVVTRKKKKRREPAVAEGTG